MTNEMHNSYNQFFIPQFLSALHVSKESSRSSLGARHNILYYTVYYILFITQYNWYNRAYSTIVPVVPNCVIQYDSRVFLMMND